MAFLEEYTLLDELGQGGYATVYKVRHNKLGYIRAIRVLNAIIAKGEEDKTYQKFLEECRLLLRLGNGNNPNIVHIYQPLLRAQRAIVEMDYVDGVDLFHYLEKKSCYVETNEVLKLLSDIGGALAYCHDGIYKFCMDKDEDGLKDDPDDGSKLLIDDATRQRLIKKYRVIHNDIHSGNIIRRENGNYVLLDFGLAIDGDSVVRSSRRRNGAPEFKAPEKWDNDGTLTTQSDIYSFGVVLYEFLAGRVPFLFNKQNSNPIEAEYLLSKAHKEQQPESIFTLRKEAFERTHPGENYKQDYPQWLESVIMKCLAKNPADRYKNGQELYDEIIKYSRTVSDDKEDIKKKSGEYENKLAELRNSLASYQKGFARLTEDLADAASSKESLHNEIKNLKKENTSLQSQFKELKTFSDTNEKEVTDLQIKLSDSKKELAKAESEISRLNTEVSRFKRTPPLVRSGKKWRFATFVFLFISIILGGVTLAINADYSDLLDLNRSYRNRITSLEESLNEKDIHINNLTNNVKELERKWQGTNNKTDGQLRNQIATLNAQINNLKNQVAKKDKEIQALKNVYVN